MQDVWPGKFGQTSAAAWEPQHAVRRADAAHSHLQVGHGVAEAGGPAKGADDAGAAPGHEHLGVAALVPEQLAVCEPPQGHALLQAGPRARHLYIGEAAYIGGETHVQALTLSMKHA